MCNYVVQPFKGCCMLQTCFIKHIMMLLQALPFHALFQITSIVPPSQPSSIPSSTLTFSERDNHHFDGQIYHLTGQPFIEIFHGKLCYFTDWGTLTGLPSKSLEAFLTGLGMLLLVARAPWIHRARQ